MNNDSQHSVTVAAVQMNPRLKMTSENLTVCVKKLSEATERGARLIAFPELTLTGYIFESREEALSCAETIPGPSADHICNTCASLGIYAVFGLIEKKGSTLFNTAVLCGPNGIVSRYRKTHLPVCGVDRFVERGDIPYSVSETGVGKIGLQICYDVQHPEGFRCLALDNAEIIVNIANYPVGVEFMSQFILPTRVLENKVHLLTCDRTGIEQGIQFLGHSSIIAADSRVISRAQGEEIIYGTFDLTIARIKKTVIAPGKNENDLFRDRRPELYQDICRPFSA